MASELEMELERTTAMRGFRYGMHEFVVGVGGVEALKKHNERVFESYLKESLLDRKTKELLFIVAYAAEKGEIPQIQMHMHAAHKAGATKDEIMEAIQLVGGVIGGVAGGKAMEAWRILFRPDIPTILRVAELR